ncbi:P-loop containing nucleoside triphosphate hydrolase protein, partial [Phlegmacium glaucopus]
FTKNPSAQFSCPEQVALLELMILRSQSVLAVLGTGTGKTFIVLMQAALQQHLVTIVVLPLSSLHDDLKRRATELQVSYSRWSPKGKFNMNVNVISVSIEHLGFPEFVKFILELEHRRQLGPIVFDEIHKVITDSDYRDAFQNFYSLHNVKAVLFGLTGSLPPDLYLVLCQLTAMPWKVLRTSSSRKELRYQVVVKVKTEREMDDAIVAHLHTAISLYRREDRAIIFTRSKNQAAALAQLFKVNPYYAVQDQAMLERNKDTMTKWLSGENKVMVSTSILGCGIDYAHIQDVVHREPSFSMIDQYQEDSRGGRDGLECRATTFVVDQKKYQVPKQLYDVGTKLLLESMNDTVNCQRIAPTLYLDG